MVWDCGKSVNIYFCAVLCFSHFFSKIFVVVVDFCCKRIGKTIAPKDTITKRKSKKQSTLSLSLSELAKVNSHSNGARVFIIIAYIYIRRKVCAHTGTLIVSLLASLATHTKNKTAKKQTKIKRALATQQEQKKHQNSNNIYFQHNGKLCVCALTKCEA